jgi:sulfopyruvate decarboxylase TPP-binding subunit
LKEITQRKIFDYLLKNKIYNFVGVPDSTMKYFIDQGLKRNKILIATREEEAIGIAVGMSLHFEKTGEILSKSQSNSLVFMQNAGFANSISTITSLVQLYQIPMIFLIGWRGFLENDAPEHTKIGKIQPKLLQALSLQSMVLDEKSWKKSCDWALKLIRDGKLCALIIPRQFVD